MQRVHKNKSRHIYLNILSAKRTIENKLNWLYPKHFMLNFHLFLSSFCQSLGQKDIAAFPSHKCHVPGFPGTMEKPDHGEGFSRLQRIMCRTSIAWPYNRGHTTAMVTTALRNSSLDCTTWLTLKLDERWLHQFLDQSFVGPRNVQKWHL